MLLQQMFQRVLLMAGPQDFHTSLDSCLDRFRAGDAGPFNELISRCQERLRWLARKMLRSFPKVQRWEETDDVLQNALLRLQKALAQVKPVTTRQFFGLAATQIRRELIDLARHYYGPEGLGANHASDGVLPGLTARPLHERAVSPDEPPGVTDWTAIHEQVDCLPAEEREVFNLLWYHDLSQAEAAVLLNISERTVGRRWRSARVLLHKALTGDRP
jgi:RNA polymerase sigma-70 factor (ECF subfamily)